MDIQKYTSRPITIEAVRLLPEEGHAYKDREQRAIQIVNWIEENGGQIAEFDGDNFLVSTLEGAMHATPGSWIIRGTEGEFYPVKDSVFTRKYDIPDQA